MLLWAFFAAIAASGSSDDELLRELGAVEEARSLALENADIEAVDRLYAEEFVGISASGELVRKKELLENVRRRGPQELTFRADELEVRRAGEVVILIGRIRGRDPSGAVVRDGRFLHVFGQRGGEWKVLAAQATPLSAGGGAR